MFRFLIGLFVAVGLYAVEVENVPYNEVKKSMKNSSKLTVVILGNNHCPFCKITMDSVKKLSPRYDEKAKFYYVDLDQNEQVREEYSVFATPNVLFFAADGKLVEQKIGGLNEIGFAKRIDAFTK